MFELFHENLTINNKNIEIMRGSEYYIQGTFLIEFYEMYLSEKRKEVLEDLINEKSVLNENLVDVKKKKRFDYF